MKKSAFIKKIAEAIIECIREELPRLISAKMQPPPAVREEHDGTPYLKQIVAAQQFLNENRNADLSHVKCLLRQIMPKEYHDEIDKLHEREDPSLSASSTAARTSSPRTRSRRNRTYRIVHPKNEYILHRQLNIYCNC